MDPLAPLIASLHGEGRLRVWSLVITAFGDLVQHRGGAISSARLGVLMDRIGVERGALRTALSRLDADGWVDRERDGRASICRLSRKGLDQFGPATSTIYAAPRERVDSWTLSLTLTPNGSPDFTLAPAAPGGADCSVSGRLGPLTPAFRAALLPDGCRAALARLAEDLQSLTVTLPEPLDAAAARLLLVHRWRRIVLRYPEPWPQLLPADSPLTHPRESVAAAYGRLAAPAETWLDTALAGDPAMPPADPGFATRFGRPGNT